MHNCQHPGEVLLGWIEGQTMADAAVKLGLSPIALSQILTGEARVCAETDVRFSAVLGTSPGYWTGMQGDREPPVV